MRVVSGKFNLRHYSFGELPISHNAIHLCVCFAILILMTHRVECDDEGVHDSEGVHSMNVWHIIINDHDYDGDDESGDVSDFCGAVRKRNMQDHDLATDETWIQQREFNWAIIAANSSEKDNNWWYKE